MAEFHSVAHSITLMDKSFPNILCITVLNTSYDRYCFSKIFQSIIFSHSIIQIMILIYISFKDTPDMPLAEQAYLISSLEFATRLTVQRHTGGLVVSVSGLSFGHLYDDEVEHLGPEPLVLVRVGGLTILIHHLLLHQLAHGLAQQGEVLGGNVVALGAVAASCLDQHGRPVLHVVQVVDRLADVLHYTGDVEEQGLTALHLLSTGAHEGEELLGLGIGVEHLHERLESPLGGVTGGPGGPGQTQHCLGVTVQLQLAV